MKCALKYTDEFPGENGGCGISNRVFASLPLSVSQGEEALPLQSLCNGVYSTSFGASDPVSSLVSPAFPSF